MQWIKASERLPDETKKAKQWRDADTKAPISSTAAHSAIKTDQKEFVEWLDESTPTVPAGATSQPSSLVLE